MGIVLRSRVAELLLEKQISWAEFAKRTGIAQSTLGTVAYRIVNCRMSTLVAVADALNVSVKDLFEEVSEKAVLPQPQMGPVSQKRSKAESQLTVVVERWMKSKEAAHLTANPMDSIQKNKVVCLECGREGKLITSRHLKLHGLTARKYKQKWGIPLTKALIAETVVKAKSESQLAPDGLKQYQARMREMKSVQ